MAKKLSALTPTGRRALLVRLFERIELELNSTPKVIDLKDLNARLILYEKLKGLLQEIEMKPKPAAKPDTVSVSMRSLCLPMPRNTSSKLIDGASCSMVTREPLIALYFTTCLRHLW